MSNVELPPPRDEPEDHGGRAWNEEKTAGDQEIREESIGYLPRKLWLPIAAGILFLLAIPSLFIAIGPGPSPNDQLSEEKTDDSALSDNSPFRRTLDDSPTAAGESTDTLQPPMTHIVDAEATQRRAIVEAQRARLEVRATQLRQLWTQLSGDAAELNATLLALLNSSDGRKLAASSVLIEQFKLIRDAQRLSETEIDGLRDELDALLAPIEDLRIESISPELEAALEELAQRIRAPQRQYSDGLRTLQRIIAAAGPNQPVATTLEETLRQRDEQFETDKIRRVSEAAEEARRAATDRAVAEAAQREQQLAEAEAELRRVRDKEYLDGLQSEIDKAKAERELAAKKAALEREFRQAWPRMASYLKPFTSVGMTQPKGRSFVPSNEEGPVSLSALRGTDALNPDFEGRKLLYYMSSTNNDRELGAFPRYFGGAQEVLSRQELMMTIQQFLNKYGDLMVEKGLLAE